MTELEIKFLHLVFGIYTNDVEKEKAYEFLADLYDAQLGQCTAKAKSIIQDFIDQNYKSLKKYYGPITLKRISMINASLAR